MNYKIRLSTLEDLPVLMTLAESARNIMRASGNLYQWVNGYPSEDVFRHDILQGCSYLMLDAMDRPVATFAFIPGPDPTYAEIFDDHLPSGELLHGAWLDDDLPYGVVHRIASLPDAHGVMSTLLEYCSRHCPTLRIDTHRDNRIMQHLLEKAGFSRCGIIYLLNGDERLAYQKLF